jgi:uncharacterized membrane protein YjgN (DUF898 family)
MPWSRLTALASHRGLGNVAPNRDLATYRGDIPERVGMNDQARPETTARRPLQMSREHFTFTGTAREYFGIWIVNVLLTIITLGVYSAWAKVRRQRYFYGNTWLAGANFDYHARPVRILIGRMIVLAVLVAYNLALQFQPILGGLIAVALIFAAPWFIMRGLRFNARVTSYRNIRFDFTGKYGGGFLAYVLGVALIYGSGGILAPLASQWMWGYTLDNLRYADRPIKCEPRLEKLYRQWWLPALVLVGGVIVLGMVVGLAIWAFSGQLAESIGVGAGREPSPYAVLLAFYLVMIPFLILYAVAGLLYRAGTRNVALNETIIDGRHALSSSIDRGRYAWISVTNLAATLFSLGLARPWAAIRMARYLASVTALDTTGALDDYVGSVKDSGSAVGAGYIDVEGFDLGF